MWNQLLKYLKDSWTNDKKSIWSLIFLVGGVLGYGLEPTMNFVVDYYGQSVKEVVNDAIKEHEEKYHSVVPLPDEGVDNENGEEDNFGFEWSGD